MEYLLKSEVLKERLCPCVLELQLSMIQFQLSYTTLQILKFYVLKGSACSPVIELHVVAVVDIIQYIICYRYTT